MSTLLDADERTLQSVVRGYLDSKIAPLVVEHESARTFPWEVLAPLYEFGYVRGVVSRELGGDGLSTMMQAILMEEAGRCWGSLRLSTQLHSSQPASTSCA